MLILATILTIVIYIALETLLRMRGSIVAELHVGNNIIGFAEMKSDSHCSALFVHPLYQSLGWGKNLLRHIGNHLNKIGETHITFTTSPFLDTFYYIRGVDTLNQKNEEGIHKISVCLPQRFK